MKKKNGFLTFCCACMPGAGQMYLGFMKRGLSLLSIFIVAASVPILSRGSALAMLVIICPIVWCYAFFDTFNLRSQGTDPAEHDDYLIHLTNYQTIRKHRLLGIGCILIGLYLLYEIALSPLLWVLSDLLHNEFFNSLVRNMPSLVLAALLILLGAWMIKGGKRAPSEPDYVAYKGENADESNNE